MTESENKSISADEVALYDRQIRLWGMEAQTRLRNSKVLVINVGALANEIIKNIVLAGIGSLTILDANTVTESDLGAQFFLEESDVGKNRAEAALPRIKELNPRVDVAVNTSKVRDNSKEWISEFDVVVATELQFPDLEYVNSATRSQNKALYATGLAGLYGYAFADLVNHSYTIEQIRSNIQVKIGVENPRRKIESISSRKDASSGIIDTILKTETYKSIDNILQSESCSSNSSRPLTARRALKVSPVLPALLAVWALQRDGLDLSGVQAKAEDYARQLGLPVGIVNKDIVSRFVGNLHVEVSPVAAVLGGIVGQEVLNYISKKQNPLQNLLIFDGDVISGPIYCL